MDTSTRDLPSLFEQLGLASDADSINDFIKTHYLQPGLSIVKAPFWSLAQSAFLKESLVQDSDWAPVVDELATALNLRKSPRQPY